ncbi:protein RESPONSE TO LOW SULFUR 1-like [Phragmites australis]|uniref:protein RESPONSE TO LOW SULFUR 1-like n=1 Tax=Phragmites australis TaxID=29695 RepID=UPI002D786F33|nr:protein RESPONSE TO LOW SULFUR 1-like [Phragmites australis]
MAPAISIGIAMPASGGVKKRSVVGAAAEEAELLRRRNAELEREVAALRAELDAARRRAETAEEAEERLCVQLGEAEVDAVELARAYQDRVEELARELAAARAHSVPARSY